MAVSRVIGTVKGHLQLWKKFDQKRRAASARTPVLAVAGVRDALHAEDVATRAFTSNWLDANFVAYPALVFLAQMGFFYKVFGCENGCLQHQPACC